MLFNTLASDEPPSNRELPDYVGEALDTVIADLGRRDLTYEVVEEQNDQFQDGIVHRTDPGAGTVMPEGESVQLFVNPTNDTAVVPDVSGMTVDEARQALEAAGFRVVEVATEESGDVAAGRVIRTEPPAGDEVGVQDRVTLVVAGDDAAATTEGGIEVPHLIGDSEASARQQLADVGLEVEVVYIEDNRTQWIGNVMDQDPRSPARLDDGDVVTINVGEAPDIPVTTSPPQTNPPQTNPPPTNPPPTNPPPTNPPPTNPPPTTAAPTTTTAATTTAP